jgi:ABC-type transport system involved in cytochrome bd biosynthesis fused ATPase/permease subunit
MVPIADPGGFTLRRARTFMKFNSGQIRFLAVDEPSSALDAEGEEYLLDNLLKEREGKTIVFVTHKFGKLTRQADFIVYVLIYDYSLSWCSEVNLLVV